MARRPTFTSITRTPKAPIAGRADIRLRNGDLNAEVTASECWSTMFRRTSYSDSASWLPTEGSTDACAFAQSDLP